ncbi:hypothetical protein [Ancylobacter radicis]|uniref:Histidine kinase n=1 Tax=Ancylobacter radicis TaxID=2836179 RepID=A0ABS5RC61_9HYPH|nr:hypothetical protein [Ancylobacter radicis]MBS9479250.1 hypothetical protein [Ancylobacter radicis]
MADYYPLLARALGGLPDRSEAGRRTVYDRARRALLTQLRNADPPLREEDIDREQRSLEEAIRRLEQDYAAADDPVPASTGPAPDEGEPVVATPEPAPMLNATPPRVPQAAREAFSAPRRSSVATAESDDDELTALAARRPGRGTDADDPALSATDDFSSVRSDGAGPDAFDPRMTGERHPASEDEETGKGKRGRLIAIALVLLLVVAGAVVGFSQRATIVAMMNGGSASGPAPVAEPDVAAPSAPEVTKSNDRIAQAAPEASRAAPAAPQGAGVGVAQRAVMFEESAGGGEQSLQQYVGSVVWSAETFQGEGGTGPDIGIRAVVTIPDRNVKVVLRLRRNQDPGIPASHIIEVQFELPPNFDLGNAGTVPGMRAKASEGAQGVPLIGLPVRVAPGYFLIGLSSLDADRQRNLSLLITRNFLDLPVVFENGRRAILVLEKGVPGDQAFREVYSKWGLPVPSATAN